MSTADAYLVAAGHAVELLRAPEVAAAWGQPSALAGMSVGGLAGHLAYQVFSVGPTLDEPGSEEPPIPLLEHYARAAWLGAALDSDANTGIRTRGEAFGSDGPELVCERADAAFAELQVRLVRLFGGQAVFLPSVGWSLTLDDFLTTRMLELVVHMDDLAYSVDMESKELPDEVYDPVLLLLARLAVRRHGQAALVRALARKERAPEAINAI